jgi:hypothetical protein
VQSVAAVHAVPFSLRAHTEFVQCAPVAQSPSTVHLDVQRNVFASHRNGTQLVVEGVQSPDAPHFAAAAAVSLSAHFAVAQAVPWVGATHPPMPSQTPSVAQTPTPNLPQSASGSVAFFTGPHVPSVPVPFFAFVQASQGPSHAVSQQIPSAQKPLVHSLPSVQGDGVHAVVVAYVSQAPLPSQKPSCVHAGAPSSVQSFRESFPAVTAAHVPLTLPVSARAQPMHFPPQTVLQQTPSAQKPEAHVAATAHAVPSASSERISPVSSAPLAPLPPVTSTRPSARSVAA